MKLGLSLIFTKYMYGCMCILEQIFKVDIAVDGICCLYCVTSVLSLRCLTINMDCDC